MPKFQPGTSGNPDGRPVGVGRAAALRRSLERKGRKVLTVVVEAALKGDLQACRLVLDRVCPPLRPIDQPVHVPDIDVGADQGAQVRLVLSAAVAGGITPAQAADLLTAAAQGARVLEALEFERRIARLEDHAGLLSQPAQAAPAVPAPTNGHERDRY
jgi:hypothetical protein